MTEPSDAFLVEALERWAGETELVAQVIEDEAPHEAPHLFEATIRSNREMAELHRRAATRLRELVEDGDRLRKLADNLAILARKAARGRVSPEDVTAALKHWGYTANPLRGE